MDKRTCKIKRNISLLLLKQGRHQEALEEMKQVEVSLKPTAPSLRIVLTLIAFRKSSKIFSESVP